MSFGESLTNIRKSKGISRKNFADQLEIPYTTLRNYETNQREPGHKLLIRIATLLQVSVDELIGHQPQNKKAPLYSSEAIDLARDYDGLDSHGKRVIRMVADEEKARCTELAQTTPAQELAEIIYTVPGYALPMSARAGEPAGQEPPEDYSLKKAPPRGTSYIARVHGESMEPTYFDGQLVFVHATEEIPVGKIGVFFMDGQQWVKELGEGELTSHNSDYASRPITEDIRCQGLVLGVCDESYFE